MTSPTGDAAGGSTALGAAGQPCPNCGWPAQDDPCDACGTARATPLALEDAPDNLLIAAPQPENYPDLKLAFAAWAQKDYPRMIGQCLMTLGITNPIMANLATGPGWCFNQASALICLLFDKQRGEIRVESPILRVPNRQRVPFLRALLELNARALGASRFCLRGSTVVLRYADRAENVSPAKLCAAIKEVALHADRYDDVLSMAFGAKMLGPEARRHNSPFSFLGTSVTLKVIKAEPVKRRPTAEVQLAASTGEQTVASAHAMLEVIRLGKSLAQVLMQAGNLVAAAMLHRAVTYHASYVAKGKCPDAMNFLFTQALAAYPEFAEGPPLRDVVPEGVSYFERALEHVLLSRTQVGTYSAPTIPDLKSTSETMALMTKVAAAIKTAPAEPALQHVLLLGALCELAQRSKITGPLKDRVMAAITKAMAAGVGSGSHEEMMALMQRLTTK